jgi:hypothetical protein
MREKEPTRELEIWCAYCGDGWKPTWQLVTDIGEELVCHYHRFVLRELHAVEWERKIGADRWEPVPEFGTLVEDSAYDDEDLGDWKDLVRRNDQGL